MNDTMQPASTPVSEQLIETAIDDLLATNGLKPARWFVAQVMVKFKAKPNPAEVQKIAERKLLPQS